MNYLDVIILIILIVAAVNGYKKGLIYQLASLASLVLGIYLAIKFASWAAPFFEKIFSFSANTSVIIAFVLIFILVSVGIYFIGKTLEKAFEDIELTSLNKLAGVVFAIVKSVLVLSVLIFLLKFFTQTSGWPKEETRKSSMLFERVESIAPAIFPYFVKDKNN